MFCVNFITQVFEIIHFSTPPVRFVGEEFLICRRGVSGSESFLFLFMLLWHPQPCECGINLLRGMSVLPVASLFITVVFSLFFVCFHDGQVCGPIAFPNLLLGTWEKTFILTYRVSNSGCTIKTCQLAANINFFFICEKLGNCLFLFSLRST